MLACICAGAESPLTLVEEIHVFGSFARGALEPHDVDVAVEFTPDEEFVHDMVRSMSQGRFPYAGLRTALTGRSRGLQFQFRELENLRSEKVETLLLWRMGEKIATATARLAAIKPDPAAGRAEHDAMLPALQGQFEGISRVLQWDVYEREHGGPRPGFATPEPEPEPAHQQPATPAVYPAIPERALTVHSV